MAARRKRLVVVDKPDATLKRAMAAVVEGAAGVIITKITKKANGNLFAHQTLYYPKPAFEGGPPVMRCGMTEYTYDLPPQPHSVPEFAYVEIHKGQDPTVGHLAQKPGLVMIAPDADFLQIKQAVAFSVLQTVLEGKAVNGPYGKN